MMLALLGAAALAASAGDTAVCLPQTAYSVQKDAVVHGSAHEAASAADCSLLCRALPGCRCFTYEAATRQCWPLASCDERRSGAHLTGFISGDAGCDAGSADLCRLKPQEAVAGMLVVRGPQWKWREQDGGAGSVGDILAAVRPCSGGQWVQVKWRKTRVVNAYRVGCDGQYDLMPQSCFRRSAQMATSCAFDDIFWPEGSVPDQSGACVRGGSVPLGAACSFSKPGHSCDSAVCQQGQWSTLRPECRLAVGTCPFNALALPEGSTVVPGLSGCHAGGQVPSGGKCSFNRRGYSCSAAACSNGQWADAAPRCDATVSRQCPFSSLAAPQGANGVGEGCAPNGEVAPGRPCMFSKLGHTCEITICGSDGSWSQPAPKCTPNSCELSKLTLPAGARPTGACAGASAVAGGSVCSFEKPAHTCTMVVCTDGGAWSAAGPTCSVSDARKTAQVAKGSPCLVGVQFNSEQGGNARLDRPAPELPSAQDCSHTCGTTEGCACFTWNADNRRCVMLRTCTAPEARSPQYVSGPADCKMPAAAAPKKPKTCRLQGEDIKLGMKVRRGPDWKWAAQDGMYEGTVMRRVSKCKGGWWVTIQWKATGIKNHYRACCGGKCDLCPAEQALEVLASSGAGGRGRASAAPAPATAVTPAPAGTVSAPAAATVAAASAAPSGRGAPQGRGSGGGRGAPAGGRGAPAVATPAPTTAAAPEVAPEPLPAPTYKCEKGVGLKGGDLMQFVEIATVEACQDFCSKAAECVGLVYRNQACTLKAFLSTPEAADAASVACFRGSAADELALPAARSATALGQESAASGSQVAEVGGGDVAEDTSGPITFPAPSATRAAYLDAHKWTLDNSTGTPVWTHNGTGATQSTQPPGYGFRCYLDEYFPGGDIVRFVGVPTAGECERRCREIEGCHGFVHRAACPSLQIDRPNRPPEPTCFTCDIKGLITDRVNDTVWRKTTSCEVLQKPNVTEGMCISMQFRMPSGDCFIGVNSPIFLQDVFTTLQNVLPPRGPFEYANGTTLAVNRQQCCRQIAAGGPEICADLDPLNPVLPAPGPDLDALIAEAAFRLPDGHDVQDIIDLLTAALEANLTGSPLDTTHKVTSFDVLTSYNCSDGPVLPPGVTRAPDGGVFTGISDQVLVDFCIVLPLSVSEYRNIEGNLMSDLSEYLATLPESGQLRPWEDPEVSLRALYDLSSDTPDVPLSARMQSLARSGTALGVAIKRSPRLADVEPTELQRQVGLMAAKLTRARKPVRYSCQSRKTFEGGDLARRENLASPDDCLQECTRTAGCQRAVFDSDGLCLLKSAQAKEADPPAEGSFVACQPEGEKPRDARAPRDFACEENRAYVGGDIVTVDKVQDAAACEQLCRRIPAECDLYVYDEQGACTLKYAGEAALVEDMPELSGRACRAVTPRSAADYQCRPGSYVGGDIMQVEEVSTTQGCQDYCNMVKQCVVAQYDSAQRCSLKNADAAFLPPSGGADQTLACAKEAQGAGPDSFHCDAGWGHSGADIAVTAVDNADDCLAACSSVPQCAIVVFSGGQCTLKGPGSAPVREQGVVSCVRKTMAAVAPVAAVGLYRCEDEQTFSGGDLFQVENVRSIEECKLHCSNIGDCVVAVLSRGVCFAKSKEAVPMDAPAQGSVACVKAGSVRRPQQQEQRDSYACESGVGYYGGRLVTVGKVDTVGACQQHCSSVPECAVAVHAQGVCGLVSPTGARIQLAGSVACVRQGAKAAKAIAGRDEFQCTEGVAYGSSELMATENVRDYDACNTHCHAVPDCRVAVLRGSVCSLQGIDALTRGPQPDEKATSCVRQTAGSDRWDTVPRGSGFKCAVRQLLGGQLFDVDGVKSARECLSHCLKVSLECKAFTYSRSGICSLRSEGAVVTSAVHALAAVSCVEQPRDEEEGPAEYACQGGMTYEGSTVRTVAVSSSEDCHAACSREGWCQGFVLAAQGQCQLKAAVGVPTRSDSALVACSRRPPAPAPAPSSATFHCSTQTVYLGGDIGLVAQVGSAAECQARCAAQQGCAVALHSERGTCYLKSSAASAVPRRAVLALLAQRTDVVEVPPPGLACLRDEKLGLDAANTDEAYRCVARRSYVGGELLTLANVTVEECQAQCSRVPQCAVATLAPEGRCSLRTAAAAPMPDKSAASVACLRTFDAEGPTAAAAGFTCGSGAGLQGGHMLDIEDVATPQECAAHCSLAAHCSAVMHSRKGGRCALHSAAAAPKGEVVPGNVVCQKKAPGSAAAAEAAPAVSFSCAKRDFAGGDLFLLDGVASIRHCRQQCAKLSSCGSFVFRGSSCLLKATTAVAVHSEADAIGCAKVEGAAARKDHLGRPAEQCVCASSWTAPADGGSCDEVQHGCPARVCDGSERRWCRVANPGCRTEELGGWSFCGEDTLVEREGPLVAERAAGALSTPPGERTFEQVTFNMVKTSVTVGGALTARIGLGWREDGSIWLVEPATTAAASGIQVGQRIIAVNGADVDGKGAAAISAAFDALPDGPFTVTVSKEVPPLGLVWYLDFAHLLHIPHMTADVFKGLRLPDFGDNEPATGGFWVHTRVKAALGTVIAPFAEQWHAIDELIKAELKAGGGNFHKHLNPILQQLSMKPLEEGNVESAAKGPRFHARAPIAKLHVETSVPDTACAGMDDNGAALLAQFAACLGVGADAMQLTKISQGGIGVSVLYECPTTQGVIPGCLNANGESVEQLRRDDGACNESLPAHLFAPAYSTGPKLTKDLPTDECFVTLTFTVLAPQNESLPYDARHQELQNWFGAKAIAAKQCPVGALTTTTRTHVEAAEEVPGMSITPAPTGAGEVADQHATPIPELPPADFVGWEEGQQAAMSAAAGRRLLQVELDLTGAKAGQRGLLQFQKKASQRKPVMDGEGKAVYDPHRRMERIRQAEAAVVATRRARRGHTLQAATGYLPGVIQKACQTGVQSPQYGLLSNAHNLDNNQPLQSQTLQQCIDACSANPDCHAFSRQGLGTSADDEPGECYLKRGALPYCADQYAWNDWGTYITDCEDTANRNPCTWSMVEGKALALLEEYKTRMQMDSAEECRAICERLDDCQGVSWKKWTGTCWFIHDKETSGTVAHEQYNSYMCQRMLRAPGNNSGGAGTPAPPGFGDCRDNAERCNQGEGTVCYNGIGTYRCGCAPGYICDGTKVDCADPTLPKVCVKRPAAPAHPCEADTAGCAAVQGGICYQGEDQGYVCGCKEGYHCMGPNCGDTQAPLNCVLDHCMDEIVGPNNWAAIKAIPSNPTIAATLEALMQKANECPPCTELKPLLRAVPSAGLTDAQSDALAAADANCHGQGGLAPTPTPTGLSLADAWTQAFSETVHEANAKAGSLLDIAGSGRVQVMRDCYAAADWNVTGTRPGMAAEPLDVTVKYVPVHSVKTHKLSMLLQGVAVDGLFGDGARDGLPDGLSATPLQAIRDQLAAAAVLDLDHVAIARVCVERAITGEILACYDAEGRPEGCFSPGVRFVPADLIMTVPNVSSAAVCQDKCALAEAAGCKFFTYETATRGCDLLRSKAGIALESSAVSGPVSCAVEWGAPHCTTVHLQGFADATGKHGCDGPYQQAAAPGKYDGVPGSSSAGKVLYSFADGTYGCYRASAPQPGALAGSGSLCAEGQPCMEADWWMANLLCGGGPRYADLDANKEVTICQHKSKGTSAVNKKGEPYQRDWTGQTADQSLNLTCPAGKVLSIHEAFYGRKHCNADLCFGEQTGGRTNCDKRWCNMTGATSVGAVSADALGVLGGHSCTCEAKPDQILARLRAACGHETQSECEIEASPAWLSAEMPRAWWSTCPEENKYLWVKYSCVSTAAEERGHAGERRAYTLADAARECGKAAGGCSARVHVSMDVAEVEAVRVVQMPDGSIDVLETCDVLPSGVKVTAETGAVGPLDTVEANNVIGQTMENSQMPFVSEGLAALLDASGPSLVSASGLLGGRFGGVCHEATEGPRADCSGGWCRPADGAARESLRTSCSGEPQCTPSFCNGHGAPSGYYGRCACECAEGYVGERCDICDLGYTGYPSCRRPPASDAAEQAPRAVPSDAVLSTMRLPALVELATQVGAFRDDLESKAEVLAALRTKRDGATPAPQPQAVEDAVKELFQVALTVPAAQVQEGRGELRGELLSALSRYGALDVELAYACRAAVCAPECPAGPVAQWAPADRAECTALKAGAGEAVAGDEGAGSPFAGLDGSVAELSVSYSPRAGEDRDAQVAMTVVAIESAAGRPGSPLAKYGILGVTTVSRRPEVTTTEAHSGMHFLEENLVPFATLLAVSCVCLFVLLVLYARFLNMSKQLSFDSSAKQLDDLFQWPADSPMSGAEDSDFLIVWKGPDHAMGITWEDHTLVAAIAEGSAAARAGMRSYIGRRVTHINDRPVHRLADIKMAASGATRLVMRFAPEVVPVCLHVDISLDCFSEANFLQALAQALQIGAYKLSVVAVSEESAQSILVTVCFAGVSGSFIRQLLTRCEDIHDPLHTRLAVGGAYVADRSDDPSEGKSQADGDEAAIWVSCQWCEPEIASCSGTYRLNKGFSVNGQCVWEKVAGSYFVFSTPDGRWSVTRSPRDFHSGSGLLHTKEPHGGMGPECSGPWVNALGKEVEIVVADHQIVVEGFRVGQRITSAEDVTERGRVIVPAGHAGWVTGATKAEGAVGLRVRFDTYDCDVNVLPDEVDSARGPVVQALSPGGIWREAMIINSYRTRVKIHYIGYGHAHDEWIDGGSDRIKSAVTALPAGAMVQLSAQGLAKAQKGCLKEDESGVVVKDAGPQSLARYKVRSPSGECSWYSEADLSVVWEADDSPAPAKADP